MSEPDDTERVQKVDPEEVSASEGGSNGKNGSNGHAHKASAEPEGKANVKIEASRDSGREKSVEDALEAFITRANTQAIEEFDGWGVAGDKDAERPQGTPAPELLNKSTLVGRPVMPDDKVGKAESAQSGKKRKPAGTPKNGSAIQAHAAVAAQAAEIALRKAPPEDIDIDTDDDAELAAKPAVPAVSDKTEVVAKLPKPPVVAAAVPVAAAPPVVVKKGLGLPALLVAFAAGAVVVFFVVRMTMKKDTPRKDTGVNAVPTAPADPTGSAAAPGPVAAPVAAGAPALPAPAAAQPDPAAVAAPAPAVEPLPVAPAASAAPAPVVEPIAPAPAAAAAPAVVEPAPAPIVTPLPVEAKKPTAKPAAKPVAAKPVTKPAAVKGSIADPFATPAQKPASKPTKSTPKKTTPKKAGGIVDPFAN